MVVLGAVGMGCSGGAGDASEGVSEVHAEAIQLMERATGHAWSVKYDTTLGTAHLAEGRAEGVLGRAATPAQATVAFLADHRQVFEVDEPSTEYTPTKEARDEDGWTHVRLQQHVRGIPVFGGQLLSHYDPSGALTSVSTLYFPRLRALDVNPAFAATVALDKAVAHWKANFQPTFETRDFDGEAKIELGIYLNQSAQPALAYSVIGHVDLTDTHDPARMVMMIDAKTGAVIEAADQLQTITGSGVDDTGTRRTIQVSGSGSSFTLVDTTRGRISTNDLKTGTTGGGTPCTSTTATGVWDTSCVGGHRIAEVTYDYYRQVHGRRSIDDNNAPILSVVNYGIKYNNAFWGQGKLTYGDGDGTMLLPTTRGIDVAAHELTHGVTELESGLGYTNSANGADERVDERYLRLLGRTLGATRRREKLADRGSHRGPWSRASGAPLHGRSDQGRPEHRSRAQDDADDRPSRRVRCRQQRVLLDDDGRHEQEVGHPRQHRHRVDEGRQGHVPHADELSQIGRRVASVRDREPRGRQATRAHAGGAKHHRMRLDRGRRDHVEDDLPLVSGR